MRVVAFIPARGGSKRIPRKNLRKVGGMSLLVRSIAHAQAAGIERIVVSTEDLEIAHAASQEPGVEIHVRPRELASDGAQIEDAIAHWAETDDAWDAMVLLQPTSPLRRPETIRACLDAMSDHGDTAHTIVDHAMYDHRCREPDTFDRDAGCVYAFTRQHWERERCRYWGPDIGGVFVDRFEAMEVDDPRDLLVAEALLAARETR